MDSSGKERLMVDGYSFNFHKLLAEGAARYKCTSKCTSYLILSKEDIITKVIHKHNHPRPNYIKLGNGNYLRV